jgi:predicted ATP-dependent protease
VILAAHLSYLRADPASQDGKGTIRFNDTAGSMAKGSVFNATSVLRAVTGIDVADFDLHINDSRSKVRCVRSAGSS